VAHHAYEEDKHEPCNASQPYTLRAACVAATALLAAACTFKAEFAYDPVKFADFTNLSIHRALPLGKELVGRFYGTAAKKNYFEGCAAPVVTKR
jgi:hypothetical protein